MLKYRTVTARSLLSSRALAMRVGRPDLQMSGNKSGDKQGGAGTEGMVVTQLQMEWRYRSTMLYGSFQVVKGKALRLFAAPNAGGSRRPRVLQLLYCNKRAVQLVKIGGCF